MRPTYAATAIIAHVLLLASRPALASDALWIQPSGTWYGIDGSWSSFSFAAGSPGQIVDLTVSTALSEIWVIETGGCGSSQLCATARGGLFSIGSSSSWRSLGGWQLGLSDLGYGGNGDYGLDTITFTNTLTQTTQSVPGALVAAINDTDFYQGFIGLGVTQGKFGSNLTNPFIPQLAETYGLIPSHSYGYTAGANYIGENGTVASLVLGGYDTLRYEPHDIVFSLNGNTRIPSVLIRGITATVPSLSDAPTHWNSTSQTLAAMNDSIVAIIDTSTPYLWLPPLVCDRFAAAFNLTWSDDFGVYLFSDNSQYNSFLEMTTSSSLSITFSLSSYDNRDNFGQPLVTPNVVNITLTPASFALLLRYPFKNIINYTEPAIPYFPLKRSSSSSQWIIGRAFMQEAYMIMNYDESTFSVHQALFPDHATANYSLQSIERPADSPYPAYVDPNPNKGSLSPGTIAGIVLSAFAIGSIVGCTLWCCCCRRRKRAKRQNPEEGEENKEDEESVNAEEPLSPVRRMLSIIIGRKRSKKPAAHEVAGSLAQPVEVAADATHELYEMPVPIEPVELDSSHDHDDEVTDLGTDGTEGMSAYEKARRKLDRQLQGPVPSYTPSELNEKSARDISPFPHYRPSDDASPGSSPTYVNTNSLPDSLPSPLTPHPDWPPRHFDLPSPMAVVSPFPSPQFPPSPSDPSAAFSHPSGPSTQSPTQSPPETFDPSSISRSASSNVSPTSPVGSQFPPSPTYQRTPIDPSRVVCLGPLPDNLQPPQHQPSILRLVTPDGRSVTPVVDEMDEPPVAPSPPDTAKSRSRRGSSDTLGSNFTVEEENRIIDEMTRQESMRRQEQEDDDYPRSPRSMERIEAGSELVHVPQVADKRYSWEEERK